MNDLKIGPCAVIFQDEFLGVCDEGLQFGCDGSSQSVTAQQSYAQAQDRILTALNITVTANVTNAGRALALLFGETGALGISELGRRFSPRGGELRLIPLNPFDSAGYLMRRAVPNLNFRYHFKAASPHTAQITFDILPDADGTLIQSIEAGAADRAVIPANPPPDAIMLERDLASWLASLLGLAPNEIHRGEIPELKYGCIALVEGLVCAPVAEFNLFRAGVIFHHPEREGLMTLMSTLRAKLPVYEADFARSIHCDGQDFPAPAERGSISYFSGKVSLSIVI